MIHSVPKFSLGYPFMYWDYYRDRDQMINSVGVNSVDTIDLKRKASELYVRQKYSTYKQEILQHIPIRYYNDQIMPKLNAHANLDRARQMKCHRANHMFHYDVEPFAPITKNHLLSVILYCDYDQYSAKFSNTFRKLRYEESFESVKIRNREFWFQSKYLRETVQLFGSEHIDEWEQKKYIPYFTGVNCVMTVSQLTVYLHSPTSTTTMKEVSTNFASRDGMIIEFNRSGFEGAGFLYNFDCQWLSRFPAESETLFMSGFIQICVESVCIIEKTKTFHLEALFILDSMLSGAHIWEYRNAQDKNKQETR